MQRYRLINDPSSSTGKHLKDLMLQASRALEEGDSKSYETVMKFFVHSNMISDLRRMEGDAFTLEYLEWLTETPEVEATISVIALGFMLDEFGPNAYDLLNQDSLSSLIVAKEAGEPKLSVIHALYAGILAENDGYCARILVRLFQVLKAARQESVKTAVKELSERENSPQMLRLLACLEGQLGIEDLG